MIDNILSIAWIFAPAAFANMGPVIANNIPYLLRFNKPLDLGKSWRDKRIFGANKTWRGLIAGVVMATAIVAFQIILARLFDWPAEISQGLDYASTSALFIGVALGLGVGLGDAIESFFKRRRGIKPGENWVPFDQIDFMIGAVIISYPILMLPLAIYVTVFIAALIMHPVFNILSWLIGLQKKPF